MWTPRISFGSTRDEGSDEPGSAPRVAFLWGDPQALDEPAGRLVKLAGGSSAMLRGSDVTLHAVVIGGQVQLPRGSEQATLEPGSYLTSTGAANHGLSCEGTDDCVLYVRTIGRLDVAPSP